MLEIADAEAAFLTLRARRVLNFQRKAEAEGNEYHDLQPLTDLQCGYAAKMRFNKGPSGQYRPEVIVARSSKHHAVAYDAEGRLAVASKILGGPAVALDDKEEHQTFCLAKDN
jgi:hypothetical protein